MQYESAVNLKRQFLSESRVRASALNRASSRGMMRLSASAMVGLARAPFAIGVTGKRGDYRIAVRIHDRPAGMDVLLADIRNRTRGETDIRIVGPVTKQKTPWHQKRNRPLQIGGSVANHDPVSLSAGTIGCFVTKDGEEDFILSNNHVLANENRARRGVNILQPGGFDGGTNPADKVGDLKDYVRLKRRHHLVDCAIASIDEGVEYFFNHLETLGPIRGIRTAPLEEDERVYKVGRTTGVTEGKVTATELDQVKVGFDIGDLEFDSQIEIAPTGSEPFSLGGDSGSLIVDSDNHAVGLLFAGNDVDATYANDIRLVLSELKVDLVF